MTGSKRTIALKVWLLTFVSITTTAIVLSLSWNVIRNVIVNSSKQQINSTLQFAVAQSQAYIEKEKSGELTHEEAENEVVFLLSNMRFSTSYVWANDNHAIARVHVRDNVVGTFQQSYMRHQTLLEQNQALESDVVYEIDSNLKPLVDKYTLKINGLILLPEWEWVIGYGLYYDDLNKDIWRYFQSLLNVVVISFAIVWALCLRMLIKNK
jgi:methyl-accepting chemotaxis protein